MVCIAVFNGRLERCPENHWRIKMKAVDARSGSCSAFSNDGRTVQLVRERMVLEAPGAKEVVLCPGSGDGWLLCAVNEKHVVALAPPIVLVLQDGHGHTCVLARALGIKPHVVVLPGKVGFLVHQRLAVTRPAVGPAVVGLRLTKLRVEVQRPWRKGRGFHAVFDVVVERLHSSLAFIGHGDAGMPLKGHGEKAVQVLNASHRKHFRLPRVVVAEAKPKEITDRGLYTWGLFTVPVDAQYDAFQMVGFRAGNGEPQV